MKTKFTIACTLIFLALSGRVLAQEPTSPSAVTGIEARMSGAEVLVEWDAVTSDPISYYRVYYSTESILENDGLYDDFETTEADETSLTFTPLPGVDMLYVSVIAVSDVGLESEFFVEEASVAIVEEAPEEAEPVEDTPPVDAIPDVPAPVESNNGTVRLLKGTVESPTEILVEFSSTLTVEASKAPEGLRIEGPNGKQLPITSITIKGPAITIYTDTQEKNVVYNVQFSEPFAGKNGAPLDTEDRSVLVTGHADGKEPTATPAQQVRQSNPMAPPDPQNVSMTPELQANGFYQLTVEWAVDNSPGDLYGIVVYQTRDGQNFSQPSLVPIDNRGVLLSDVTPGFYGMYIQTINVYGYVSPGVFQYVTLPQYIPGQGFQGDILYGSTEQQEDATEVESNSDMVALETMTEDTPTEKIDGVDHSAAYEAEITQIDWMHAGILGSIIAGALVVFIGIASFTMKRNSAVAS